MGEDFIEKKNRQFRRCTDAAYDDWRAEDLFSGVPPDASSEVVGYVMTNAVLEVGDEVMHVPTGEDADCLTFHHGTTPVLQLSGEAAAFAKHAADEAGTPLTAEVVAVSPGGLATLRLHKPYKN